MGQCDVSCEELGDGTQALVGGQWQVIQEDRSTYLCLSLNLSKFYL